LQAILSLTFGYGQHATIPVRAIKTETLMSTGTTLELVQNEIPDRRKLRSVRSNRKILDAVLSLIQSGNFVPRAQDIANVSGLSLRTVFRHIDDMESLYRELTQESEQRLLPPLMKPYATDDWRARLEQSISRRVIAYEEMLPLRTAADVKRFHSKVLAQDYRRVVALERMLLTAVLPKGVIADRNLFEGLDLTLSFTAWRRLRQDQGLDVKAAERVIRRAVAALIGDVA
jgi:AcrR family transcriptional regulator